MQQHFSPGMEVATQPVLWILYIVTLTSQKDSMDVRSCPKARGRKEESERWSRFTQQNHLGALHKNTMMPSFDSSVSKLHCCLEPAWSIVDPMWYPGGSDENVDMFKFENFEGHKHGNVYLIALSSKQIGRLVFSVVQMKLCTSSCWPKWRDLPFRQF